MVSTILLQKSLFLWTGTLIKKSLVGRAPACNFTTVRPGNAKNVSNSLESFHLFITDDMINEIVTNTNNSISDFRKRFRDILADNDKYHHCAIADSIGIKAFFGLLHIRAALKVNMLSTMTISYHESSNELFAATMPVNRFSFLSTFLTFDDKFSRDERWKYEKFALYTKIFKKVNKNNDSMQYPSSSLAIDEILQPYRGE